MSYASTGLGLLLACKKVLYILYACIRYMHMECQYFFISVYLFSYLNIFPRASCHASSTADAFALADLGLAEFQADRAIVLANVTFCRAVFFVTLQSCKGKLRKQRKNRSQRAQKLAEKALLHSHADNDHAKQDDCRNICAQPEIPGGQQGKYRPRAVLCHDAAVLHKAQ